MTLASSEAFALATSIASREMSVAITRSNSRSKARDKAIAPDPVPTSAIRRVREVHRSSTRSTITSVSTRGISTRSSTVSVRCRNEARPTAYARGAPVARAIAARMTDRATSGDASATEFAAAQNLGTSSTAARMSRASRWDSVTPTDASIAVQPASRSPMVPIGNVVGKNGALGLFTKLLFDIGDLERFDEWLDFAVQHLGQLVQCEIDSVIGDAILRIVVRADLGGTITGADLCLPHARAGSFLLRNLRVEEARAEHFHGFELVLEL